MSAARDLLALLCGLGAELWIEHGKLLARRVPDDLRELVGQHRNELIDLLRSAGTNPTSDETGPLRSADANDVLDVSCILCKRGGVLIGISAPDGGMVHVCADCRREHRGGA